MADTTRSQLEQAYNLIQREDLDKAIAILKPIVAKEPDNADAWWLMANAVSEPQEAHEALSHVLRLKPNHPEAQNLLNTLNEEFPDLAPASGSGFSDNDPGFDDLFGSTTTSSPSTSTDFGTDDLDSLLGDPLPADSSDDDFFSSSSAFSSSAPASSSSFNSNDNLDDLFATDDLFADSEPQFVQDGAFGQSSEPAKPVKQAKPPKQAREPKPKPTKVPKETVPDDPFALETKANRRPSPFMLIGVVLFVIIIAAAIVAVGFMTGAFGGNNANAIDPAVAALSTSTSGEMTQNGFKSSQAVVSTSSLGKTFMITTCSTLGPDLPGKIDKAMDISAKAAATIKDTIKGAGVQVVSCAKPDVTLYRAIAPIDKVVAYVTGNMADVRTFRSSWVKS